MTCRQTALFDCPLCFIQATCCPKWRRRSAHQRDLCLTLASLVTAAIGRKCYCDTCTISKARRSPSKVNKNTQLKQTAHLLVEKCLLTYEKIVFNKNTHTYIKHIVLLFYIFARCTEISQETAVNPVDIVSTLQSLQMLKYWKGKHLVLKRQVRRWSISVFFGFVFFFLLLFIIFKKRITVTTFLH